MHPLPSRSYIGIDPSLTSTGLAILQINSDGIPTLKTETICMTSKKADRLFDIHERVTTQVTQTIELGFIPQGACIEGAAFNAINRADDMGQVRGILLLLLRQFKLPYLTVAPTRLKKYATGKGGASKENMVDAALSEWDKVMSDDEADAAWLAHLACAFFDTPQVRLRKRYQLEVIHGIRESAHKDCVKLTRNLNM